MYIQNKLQPYVKGAILATTSALSMSIVMSLAKQLHPGIPTVLVVFIKSFFGLAFFLPVAIANRSIVVKTQHLKLHILRMIIVVSSMICTYYAYRHLPLAFATSIGMSGPLFTAMLSAIILKEKLSAIKLSLIILGYIGVIIVVRPSSFLLDLGTLSAISANALAASAIITVKILSRYDSPLTIVFYMNIGVCIFSFFLSIGHWQILSIHDFILISIMGLLSMIMHLCSTSAVKYTRPSFVAPFEYTRIFFAGFIGFIIFDEIPDIYTVFGSLIILTSAYILTLIDVKVK